MLRGGAQDFFGRECSAPVHLAVDTGFVDEARALRAWVGAPVALGEAVVGTAFSELPVEHVYADAERAGLPSLAAAGGPEATPQPLPNDLAGLDASVQRLHAMLELAHGYADGVVEGRLKANNAIGRFLADTVAAVPRLSREAFDKLFNDSVQDVLLVMYLSNLTRTCVPIYGCCLHVLNACAIHSASRSQLALAERLNTPLSL